MDTKRKTRIVIPHITAAARKEKRRQEAEARQAKYDSLTINKRIKLVKTRRRESKRELARLAQKLEWEKAQKAAAKSAESEAKSKTTEKPAEETKKPKKVKKTKKS